MKFLKMITLNSVKFYALYSDGFFRKNILRKPLKKKFVEAKDFYLQVNKISQKYFAKTA